MKISVGSLLVQSNAIRKCSNPRSKPLRSGKVFYSPDSRTGWETWLSKLVLTLEHFNRSPETPFPVSPHLRYPPIHPTRRLPSIFTQRLVKLAKLPLKLSTKRISFLRNSSLADIGFQKARWIVELDASSRHNNWGRKGGFALIMLLYHSFLFPIIFLHSFL